MLDLKENFQKEFERRIIDLMKEEEFTDIIFLCIGTSKIIGDAIGPIIGTKLKSSENKYMHIYGTFENNLNFNNAKNIIEDINRNYKKPCIVSIDAALSNKNKLGDIVIESGYIKLGKALGKCLMFYSHINIKCVVGNYSDNKEKNLNILKNISIEKAFEISNIVSDGIKKFIKKTCISV